MAKKRAKRFDEGGDVGTYDYASLGKRAPKDKPSEDVGIYDYASLGKRAPKMELKSTEDSEASDRFNAAMDRLAERNAQKDGEDKAPSQGGGDKTPAYKAEPGRGEAEPVKPIRQADRIISKKELEKSGFTNLTDFLNAEKGLKRKDGKAPKKAAETKVPEATPAQLAERKKQERAQALEESHPEALIIGGPLLKAGRAGLAALRSAKEVGKRIEPYIASTGRDLATRGGREVGKRMDDLRTIYDDGIPKLANKAVQLGTEALKLSRFKHGGSVKASKMGSVKTAKPKMTSASSRGDGIAQRGKTKGRIC